MTGSNDKLVDQRDLLELLNQHPLTAPFKLAFYSTHQTRDEFVSTINSVCQPQGTNQTCVTTCYSLWQECISQAIESKQPQIRVCTQGFICFAIPLSRSSDLPECLIGGGVLEQTFAATPRDKSASSNEIIDSSSSSLLVSLPEAESLTEEIVLTLPHLLNKQIHALSLQRTTRRLEAVKKLSRDLSECRETQQALDIVSKHATRTCFRSTRGVCPNTSRVLPVICRRLTTINWPISFRALKPVTGTFFQ